MLADRFGPRLVCSAGMLVHRRRPAGDQLRAVDGDDLPRLRRRHRRRHRAGLRAVDRQRAAVVHAPARASRPASPAPGSAPARSPCRCSRRRRSARSAGAMRCGAGARRARRRPRRDAAAAPRAGARRAPARPRAGMTLGEALRSRRFWWMYALAAVGAGDVHSVRARLGGGARPRHRRRARRRPGRADRHRQPRRPLRDRRARRPARPDADAGADAGVAGAVATCCGTPPAAIRRSPCSRCGSASATAASSR